MQYEEKRVLSENEQELLDQKIRILKEKIPDARAARENPVRVSVTCYMPYTDVDSEAYGVMGTHETITGICWYIDTDIRDIIRVDQEDIRIPDITQIHILGS